MNNAKSLSEDHQRLDIITTLPLPIIETILCFLPIQDAARTSILSREWRYKWTKIPKLVFSGSNVKISTKVTDWRQREDEERRKLLYAIYQVLLLRQSPIHEFTLSMEADDTCFEIDQIILHLSTNHAVNKLTLNFVDPSFNNPYNLPLSVFSMHHLKELYLDSCDFVHQPTFNGSGSLTNLSLKRVKISRETLLHLLSSCTSLKSLSLFLSEEEISNDDKPSIMELFKCLSVIEHLTTWGYIIPLLVEDLGSQELPALLINLKYFCIQELDFTYGCGFTFLFVLMKCSPNLEKIKLEINRYWDGTKLDNFKEYSDVWLEHLNELEIENSADYSFGVEFVKFILPRSPNLKKIIFHVFIYDWGEELELLRILLQAPHSSPVEIVVENSCNRDDINDDDDIDDENDDDDDGYECPF